MTKRVTVVPTPSPLHLVTAGGNAFSASQKNAEALKISSKAIGIEVNAGTIKYIDMSRDQKAGRSRSIKTDNSFLERVKEFKFL